MSAATGESLDQPSNEAIARLHVLTKGPGMDEINRLDLPRTNTDEEGSGEEFEFSDSELPSREGLIPEKKKKKKKSKSSKKDQSEDEDNVKTAKS